MTTRAKYRRAVVRLAAGFALALALPAAASAGGVYFVKEGDTLSRVSRIFGASVESLRAANRLGSDAIRPGDRLRIPDPLHPAAARAQRAVPETPALSAPPAAPDAASATQPAPAVPASPAPLPALAPAPARAPLEAAAATARVREILCREEKVFHTVAKGDTLAAIGRRYGVPLADLLRLNALRKTSRLSIGQTVLVRRSGPKTHVVLRGETLNRIAARYRVGVEDLRLINGLAGDRIVPGQQIVLQSCDHAPSGRAVPAAPPVSATAALHESAEIMMAEAAALAAIEERDRRASLEPLALTTPQIDDAGLGLKVIDLAKTMLDIPYRFGGTTLRGIDCSAYVQRVFGLLEIDLPRTAREQFGVGESIDRDQLSIGDLVFFRTYAKFPSHVGIYLGDNLFIHASSVVRKVTIDSLDRPYYTKRFIGGRRLLDDEVPVAQVASAPK